MEYKPLLKPGQQALPNVVPPPLHIPSMLQSMTKQFQSGAQAQAEALTQNPTVQQGLKASEAIGQRIAKPILDTVKKTVDPIVNTFTSPGSTYLTPALEKFGVAPGLAVGAGIAADFAAPGPGSGEAKLFQGFTDLSTKILERLKGKSFVTKQFISDLTNSADIRQPEKELIRQTLEKFGQRVDIDTFAREVKSELLPLKPLHSDSPARYEGVVLPDELRGPVANYQERVYGSPIKTSAGDVHFGGNFDSFDGKTTGDIENYFAHTRIEDLPPMKVSKKGTIDDRSQTRRVIEIQSDLFQKGRLEGESLVNKVDYKTNNIYSLEVQKARDAELSKLEPYRNTWQERVIREEVKQAAKDGKTKLQFPTGETAMKIEGLGESNRWFRGSYHPNASQVDATWLKAGNEIHDTVGDNWIITDVLGDGKFKAVSTHSIFPNETGYLKAELGYKPAPNKKSYVYKDSDTETFDISGKVDKENPIYKFYEKEVGRYLKNKYGAELVTDPQGVQWWEVKVKPEASKEPVLAFGKVNTTALMAGAGVTAGLYAGLQPSTVASAAKPPPTVDPRVDKTLQGIAENEALKTGDPYSFSKPSGSKELGRDLGKYQITEAFLRQYSPRYLGRVITPEEFLKSPALQEQFMKNRVAFLLKENYSPEQIADIHRHGSTNEPGSSKYNRPEYVSKFLEVYNKP